MPGFNISQLKAGCYATIGSNNSSLPNNLETARSNRFRLSLSIPIETGKGPILEPSGFVTLACESITRPVRIINEEKVYNGADYINVPLRPQYEPIDAVFYEILSNNSDVEKPITDIVGPGLAVANNVEHNLTVEEIMLWWTRGVFDAGGSRTTYQASRRTTVIISMLDGQGRSIWTYMLHRCWPKSIAPDPLDNKNSNILKTKVTLVYDKLTEYK